MNTQNIGTNKESIKLILKEILMENPSMIQAALQHIIEEKPNIKSSKKDRQKHLQDIFDEYQEVYQKLA